MKPPSDQFITKDTCTPPNQSFVKKTPGENCFFLFSLFILADMVALQYKMRFVAASMMMYIHNMQRKKNQSTHDRESVCM